MEITILIAIVGGLTEVFKRALALPDRFIPLMSVFFGLIVAFIGQGSAPIDVIIMTGVIAGLSASGLYDVVKKTALNK